MHNAPHDAALGAAVNAGEMVVLHDESGKTVRVPHADVEFWLGRGLRLNPFDPKAILDELQLYLGELATSATAYVDGVLNDGTIDTADEAQYAQAVHAMRLVEDAWHRLERCINARFPVVQGEPVIMVSPELPEIGEAEPGQIDWVEHRVDPGQVALYQKKGWYIKGEEPAEG